MGTFHPAEYNVPVPEVVIGERLAVDALADHELEQMGARRTSLSSAVRASIPAGAGWGRRLVPQVGRDAWCQPKVPSGARAPRELQDPTQVHRGIVVCTGRYLSISKAPAAPARRGHPRPRAARQRMQAGEHGALCGGEAAAPGSGRADCAASAGEHLAGEQAPCQSSRPATAQSRGGRPGRSGRPIRERRRQATVSGGDVVAAAAARAPCRHAAAA